MECAPLFAPWLTPTNPWFRCDMRRVSRKQKATDPKTEPIVQLSVERPESEPSASAILHLPRSTPSTAIDQSFLRDLFPVHCFRGTTLPFPYISNEPTKESHSEFGAT